MEFTVRNIELDQKNINGRLYPAKEVEKMFDDPVVKEQLSSTGLFVELGNNPGYDIDLTKVVGTVHSMTFDKEHHWFNVNVEFLETNLGRWLRDKINFNDIDINLYMSCVGEVFLEPLIDGEVVKNLKFIKFYFAN